MSNRILLLVGLPGSGKSTLSKELVKCKSGWERINQDDMGSRKACEMHAKRFLNKKLSIVIDRCNFDEKQRKTWVDLGQKYNVPVDCIVLTTTEQECSERIQCREDHPTGVIGDSGVQILKKFMRNYRPPRIDQLEGIQRVLYLDPSPEPYCTPERIDTIFHLLDQCPILEQMEEN
ncbi:P-loop containing nucleoside triphosphate hydrolase protein [Rhizopus microsporus var. microsporus]|uniref:P-loop containing nucleoside triphosphate hydrolase protein n=2 Tax=Rhizopus microsporus TaxID=58291 RepID=A0A2G4SWL6_RHIZD|nr:P-loop containing nucleoside triphosphate hydrolase protein [Rhizopus microsporus ATCC 52813]ORE01914.1 P-loop containing nucleoside triphosphate hydrolase protein [Rhizopus microsporus var. microsporus]PHZ13145.1 P-loop containing nucleoside triphosphate hydrolase protein [Rhizopus microsporus ATCC 52813]